MKHTRLLSIVTAIVLASFTGELTGATEDPSTALLAKVRQALGGEKLTRMSTVTLVGTYRRLMGEREMSGDLELTVALPDKFLRTESFGLDPTNPVRLVSGFNGDTPIQRTSGGGGGMVVRMGGPGAPGGGPGGREVSEDEMKARRLEMVHRDFARLLIVLTTGSSPVFPLEYRYGGEAESGDDKADVLDVTGPNEFAAKLIVDKETHLPLMLMYRDVQPRFQMVRAEPGQPRPSPEDIERRVREQRQAGPPPQVDVQLFVSDHKKVDGVMLPQTVRRAIDGKTVEEWTLTSMKVNPAIKADTFEVK